MTGFRSNWLDRPIQADFDNTEIYNVDTDQAWKSGKSLTQDLLKQASIDCVRNSKRRHVSEVHKLLPLRNQDLFEDLSKEIEDVFLVKYLKKKDHNTFKANSYLKNFCQSLFDEFQEENQCFKSARYGE